MKLSYYGGIDEIGGNKILLEDQDARIFLDFGMNFANTGKYFEEYLKPRTANGFGDHLALGLIPSPSTLPGFYRDDLLEIAGFKPSEPEFDAIIVSHIHYDHTADISFVSEKIPLYASEITIQMAKALVESKARAFSTEIYNYTARNSDGSSARQLVEREWNAVQTHKKFKVKNVEITPLSIDHSVPGGMTYIIHSSEGNILYSGDLRLQGTYGDHTVQMMEHAASEKIDLMLCEGTRIKTTDVQTEKQVFDQSTKILNNTKGLLIADYAFKDLTRFETFLEIARKSGRKLVIQPQDAYLIQQLQDLIPALPKTTDETIEILGKKRLTNLKTLQPILDQENVISSEEIHHKQNEKIVRLSFYDFPELIDLQPALGSQYIHSACEPFNEEMEISQERLDNWLDYFKLPKHQIHCSGHGPRQDLEQIINTVKPKTLTPIHTEYPKEFKKIAKNKTKITYAKKFA
ncbi:MAG: MBL fold metallo-hydrolase [Candidatus Diapherotrites archaeon]